MKAFVGKTDYQWFTFLRRLPDVDEVNFWRPSGRGFQAIPQHAPYLFELKAPHKAVGGFGFFTRYERLPIRLAWDTFGQANGAPDLATLVQDIGRNRAVGATDQTEIGCIMVRDVIFFKDEEFIRLPTNWPRTGIQIGKMLDLEGNWEGRQIWNECLDRAIGRRQTIPSGTPEQRRRYAEERLFRPRLGQGSFQRAVGDAYAWACAVTNEHSRPALEAAHIRPYSSQGEHDVRNGLLLRVDIHRLFDHGYVTVTPDRRFLVSDALRRDYANGRTYYPLDGHRIALPRSSDAHPSRDFLDWHNHEVFKG